MTNTKIDLNTTVDAALGTIVSKWNGSSRDKKQEMMKNLLLYPEQFPVTDKAYLFTDWSHENYIHRNEANRDEEDSLVRSEMKDVLLDILYEYAGEYAKRERPNGTGDMDQYEDLMVKFWSDVPQDIKKTVLFGDCLAFSLYSPTIVTHMDSTTKHGDDDSFTLAMNQIMNHHEGKKV